MKRRILSLLSVVLMLAMMVTLLAGCGDKTPKFSADTTIHYSSGEDSEWAYGNQQKEFPGDETCYVRIGCLPISDIDKGADTEITVTYRFTCTGSCEVKLADGIVTQVDNTEEGVYAFTRTLRALKDGETKEDIVIFQYTPNGEGSVVLDVNYGDNIDERYDIRNTVYFSGKAADVEAGVH